MRVMGQLLRPVQHHPDLQHQHAGRMPDQPAFLAMLPIGPCNCRLQLGCDSVYGCLTLWGLWHKWTSAQLCYIFLAGCPSSC